MITLAEYLGFIFSEITRARRSADHVSAAIAEAYAADPIMQHFSVPRFKIPEMTVTVPMLISGAKFSSVLKFNAEPAEFADFVNAEIGGAILKVHNARPDRPRGNAKLIHEMLSGLASASVRSKSKITKSAQAVPVPSDLSEFYHLVVSKLNSGQTESVVTAKYPDIFRNRFEANRLGDKYKKLFPKDELLVDTQARVQNFVTAHTVVDRVRMENLLVNPETNVIKTLGNEFSVFTVTAKISEEGVFVKSIKDDRGTTTSAAVEFE